MKKVIYYTTVYNYTNFSKNVKCFTFFSFDYIIESEIEVHSKIHGWTPMCSMETNVHCTIPDEPGRCFSILQIITTCQEVLS